MLSIALVVVVGLIKSAGHDFHAIAPPSHHATQALGVLLILRAFSSGATAMTGIEVISNAVPVFKPPEAENARTTLSVMIILLVTMFIGVLVVARTLQGAFGALLAPSALGLLTVTFEGSPDRPTAFGIFGAIAGGGASLGLILGGALTQALSWRWCLYVNLVIAVPTTIVALRLLVSHKVAQRDPVDIPGVLTSALGLFALVYGFSNAETHSWSATATIVALAASPVLLTVFALIERRAKHPLLPLHIIWDRGRGGAYGTIALAGAGVFAVFLFLTYFLQQQRGLSPLTTGLAFLPLTGVLVVTSTTVQTRVIQHTGVKPLVLAGTMLGASWAGVLRAFDWDSILGRSVDRAMRTPRRAASGTATRLMPSSAATAVTCRPAAPPNANRVKPRGSTPRRTVATRTPSAIRPLTTRWIPAAASAVPMPIPAASLATTLIAASRSR